LIAGMDANEWLVHDESERVVFDPVWVAGYAESCLFKEIPKVIFMSATFRQKTAELLGIDRHDVDLFEARSGFDPSRRPIYVPKLSEKDGGWGIRVDARSWNSSREQRWLDRIDQFVAPRTDRNGLIHSVSYARRNTICQHSTHEKVMISHDRQNTREVIETFKRSEETILVSPSVTTGYDFPYTECEYQIVCKVPFPDSRDPILQARQQEDPDYGAYLMMQELVQAVGRGMRAPDDQCETVVIDDHIRWVLKKYREFAPEWFLQAVRWVDSFPAPLPKLQKKER
jgi:ATP-dependent DNA helicase DinG